MDVMKDEAEVRKEVVELLNQQGDTEMRAQMIITLMRLQYFNGRVSAHSEAYESVKLISETA